MHTSDLDADTLASAQRLLVDSFTGEFSEADWDHALGGMHAVIAHRGALIAHASVVQRQLIYNGMPLRCGYVEAVAVEQEWRGQGLGNALLDAAEQVIRGAYPIGALSASGPGARLYQPRGWVCWRGTTATLTPDGPVPTPSDNGSVYVLPVAVNVNPNLPLMCDWRDGDAW